MTTLNRKRFALVLWSVGLFILAVIQSKVAAVPCGLISEFRPPMTFIYDGRNQTTVAYDGSGKSAIGYDVGAVLTRHEKRDGTTEDRASFAKIVKFLAAETGAAEQGGLNLFKFGDSTSTTASGWRNGDYFLNLPNQGSPAANWAQNSSALRSAMSEGNPIFDSYIDASTGQQIPTTGFLNAERNLLENHGWTFSPQTGAYHPPTVP